MNSHKLLEKRKVSEDPRLIPSFYGEGGKGSKHPASVTHRKSVGGRIGPQDSRPLVQCCFELSMLVTYI